MLRRLLFTDGFGLARIARERALQQADLVPLPEEISGSRYAPEALATDAWGLVRELLRSQKRNAVKTIVLFQVSVAITSSMALLIRGFLGSLGGESAWPSVLWGAGISLAGLVSVAMFAHYILTFLTAKMATTHGLQEQVLRKAWALDWDGRQQSPTGDLINRLEVDVDAVSNLVERIADALGALTHLLIATALLWTFLGWAGLASVGVLALVVPAARELANRSRRIELGILSAATPG